MYLVQNFTDNLSQILNQNCITTKYDSIRMLLVYSCNLKKTYIDHKMS